MSVTLLVLNELTSIDWMFSQYANIPFISVTLLVSNELAFR